MDIRELSAIERTLVWRDEILPMCERLGGLYGKNPKLAADVTRKAKALRTRLRKLKDFLENPK
jgi:hypothetical protein